MRRHIKTFETHDDYEDFIMNGRVLMPNVSVCEDEYDCHFNDDGTIDRVHERPGQIDPNGHEYIDLGLPSGTLWATMNVGSTVVGEYGGYYEWGETEERDNYGAHKYFDNDSGWTKYNDVDNKTELDLDDDVARVIMGGTWTLPTSAQCQELIDNCTFVYTSITVTIEGEETAPMEITGVTVTSSINGNSIFLPYAGDKYGSAIENVGNYGYIWTKNGSYVDGDADAQCLRFGNSEPVVKQVVNYEYGRTNGISARGVLTPGVTPGPEPTGGYRLEMYSGSSTALTACTLYTSYTFSTVDELIDFETNYTYGFGSLCYNTDTVPFTDTMIYYDWFTPFNSSDYNYVDDHWRVFNNTSSIRKEFEQSDFSDNPTKAAAAINAVKDRLNTYGVIRCSYNA